MKNTIRNITLAAASFAVVFLFYGFLYAAPVTKPAKPGPPSDAKLRRTPVVEAVQKVSPAVVNISTEKIVRQRVNPFAGFNDDFFDRFFDDFYDGFGTRDVKQTTLGSGVIIDARGYVITNEHVILRASDITVTLPDNREYKAEVIGADPDFDLAILKINSDKPFPFVATGDSDSLLIGETVIAIGNPYGLTHTVTTGVLSAVNRTIKTQSGRVYSDFIQTDASINPGNSGGPLVNILGEVIGINTVVYSGAEGIGFAIPINRAMRAVSDLVRFGVIKKTWTGLKVQQITPQLARTLGMSRVHGVLVADIIEDSPAAKSNSIRVGDIIVEVQGKSVNSTTDFYDNVNGFLAGEKIKLKVSRDGANKIITFEMESIPLSRADEIARRRFGFKIKLPEGDTEDTASKGVTVTSVEPGSPAAKIGIKSGDIIRAIGGKEIKSLKDFREATIPAAEQETVFVAVQRGSMLYHTRL